MIDRLTGKNPYLSKSHIPDQWPCLHIIAYEFTLKRGFYVHFNNLEKCSIIRQKNANHEMMFDQNFQDILFLTFIVNKKSFDFFGHPEKSNHFLNILRSQFVL